MSVVPADPGEPVVPRVAVVVEGQPWSVDEVALEWHWVDAPEAADAVVDPPVATGPAPELVRPEDRDWLALRAVHDGQARISALRVPSATVVAPSLGPLVSEVLPLDVAEVTAEALQLDARRRTDARAEDGRSVPLGGFVRWTVDAPSRPGTVRWMATGGGTFFELDAQTTDWAAGDLRLDDDTIEGPRSLAPPGPVTVISLWLADDDAATAFRADDQFVGPVDEGRFVAGRFVPIDGPVPDAPFLRGRLVADATSPIGVRLTEPEALAALPSDFAAADWPCRASVDGVFDPTWLLEQRCTVADLDGRLAEIAVESP